MLVGMVQGGTQALSRSLFASLNPAYESGELFGFYGGAILYTFDVDEGRQVAQDAQAKARPVEAV